VLTIIDRIYSSVKIDLDNFRQKLRCVYQGDECLRGELRASLKRIFEVSVVRGSHTSSYEVRYPSRILIDGKNQNADQIKELFNAVSDLIALDRKRTAIDLS
jgi:predicted xylose isomerase-like sugar epimerase